MAQDLAGPPPREAISFLQRKGLRPGFSYKDVWREEHAHAFTVAKAMKLDLLADIRDSLTAALTEGKPFEQWRAEMTEYLSKRGWWGRKIVTDPVTGEKVLAQLGSSRRLDTIWRVNMGQAYQHGVWQRGQRSTSHPYIMYRVGPSREHREQHLAWDGLVLPKDDAFWRTHNPRNGWGCKCTTRFVSRAQFERYQRQGIPYPSRGDAPPRTGKPIKTEAPKLKRVRYINERTGKTYYGYAGIDPGFERNPGITRKKQLQEAFQAKSADVASPQAPAGTNVSEALDIKPRGALREAILRSLGAIEQVHGDGDLPTIPVERLTAGAHYGDFSWSVLGTAVKIRVKADGPHPEMTTAHEVGHFLDFAGMDPPSAPLTPGRKNLQSVRQTLPEMRQLLVVIRASATVKAIPSLPNAQFGHYLQLPYELVARAYAQYITWKSGSPTMRAELDATLNSSDLYSRLTQWPHDEFLPIAAAIDDLFETLGWLRKA